MLLSKTILDTAKQVLGFSYRRLLESKVSKPYLNLMTFGTSLTGLVHLPCLAKPLLSSSLTAAQFLCEPLVKYTL